MSVRAAPPPLRTSEEMKPVNVAKNFKWIVFFLSPTILLFLFMYAFSMILLFGSSLTDWTLGMKVSFAGMDNYVDLLTNNEDYLKSALNTVIWICLQATLHVTLGVTIALILAKREFYWKFIRTVYMIPNIISSAALGMMFLVFLNPDFGALNSLIRLVTQDEFSQNWLMDSRTSFVTVTLMWLPFAAVVTILVLAELAAIPESIFESARVDGASEFRLHAHITLPMLRNIIGTCAILAGTGMLQKLDMILMTTGGGPGNRTMNLPIFIYQNALKDNNFGLANAAGVTLILIGIMTVWIISRAFRMGQADA